MQRTPEAKLIIDVIDTARQWCAGMTEEETVVETPMEVEMLESAAEHLRRAGNLLAVLFTPESIR